MKELREFAKKYLYMNNNDIQFKNFINEWNTIYGNANSMTMYYSSPWCACFVSYVILKCGFKKNVPLQIRCTILIEQAQKLGLWIEEDNYIPKPNDLIFYEWSDNENYANTDCNYDSDHVGIVDSVKDGFIYVIEGNKNNKVDFRKVKINGRYIRGFCKMSRFYENETDRNITLFDDIAKDVIRGKYGNGQIRKDNLKNLGYSDSDIREIQSRVNEMLR